MDIILLIFTCVVNLLLGLVILNRDGRRPYARLFFLMSFAISLWITANYFTNHYHGSDQLVEISNRLAFLFGYSAVVAGLTLTYFFPIKRRVSKTERSAVATIVVLTAVFSVTDFVAGHVQIDNGQISFASGSLAPVYMLSYLFMVWLVARNLTRLPRNVSKKVRQQARIVLIAFVVSALVGFIFNLLLPLVGDNWNITRLGPVSTILLVGLTAYAIVRHGLFDIRLVVVRTLAYVLSLSTLAILYGVFALQITQELFGYQSSAAENMINVAMALVLAFIFQPVKRFFDKVTDRIFFKDQYETNDFVARLGDVLTTTTDLRTLLHRAAAEIGTTLKSEQAFFYLRYAGDRYISAGTKDYKTLSSDEFEIVRQYMSENSHQIVIADTMPSEHMATKIMKRRSIAVMMPIVRGNDVFGYFALGESRSSGYKERDIRALETVSGSLLIAIQNSLSAQEVRELNVHLQERIKEATNELTKSNAQLKKLDKSKDEFLSLASHQLRTPLTSIKGYLSMVLEGDLGPIRKEQEKALSQSFGSAQRMVFLINDFLNVSRLQTGKFEIEKKEVDLAKLTGEEVAQLKDTAKSKQVTIEYKAPADLAPIQADANKLRQVIMNFIDNALYYSPANTVVRVQLQREGDSVVLKVVDAGIGVPVAEQANLFTKFYRATNARKQRPDGTGIGLYMAKKVIIGHRGAVIFESIEGKGSTFGFSLPIETTDEPRGKLT